MNEGLVSCVMALSLGLKPIDYQPENLVYVQEESIPPVAPPPELETPQPNLGDIPDVPKEDVPCPGPTDQRVGDMRNAESREKVVSHTLSEDGQTCITNYELTSHVEKYLPSTSQISTNSSDCSSSNGSSSFNTPIIKVNKTLNKASY